MPAQSDSLSFPKLLFSELSMHYSLNCSLSVRLHLLSPPPAEYNHFLAPLLIATIKFLRTEYNEIYWKYIILSSQISLTVIIKMQMFTFIPG